MRALTGEMQHSRPADIAARTGDQRDLALKFTHDEPSLDFVRDVERSETCHTSNTFILPGLVWR